MQTTKIFLMAALALMTAACSNDDNDIQTPAEQPAKSEGIPFTATISMGESASTRALTENGTTIEATWETGEKVALIYNVGSTPTKTDAKVTKQTDGTATISATLETGATNGSDVTIIYPSDAADGTTGNVKSNLLTAQDGTLATIASKYDVRKGTGKLSISGGKATVNNGTAGTPVALTNQFAIWKLTTPSAKDLYITADGVLIAEATLGTAGTEFYVAVPAVSSKTVSVVATDGTSNCWSYSKGGVSLATGKYYQSTPLMTTLDGDNTKDVYMMTGAGDIPDGKTVVLSDVTISGRITCSGSANIILMGTNSVTANTDRAAIRVGGTGTTLTITGSGSLTATGGTNAAGIGTDDADGTTLSGGNIVINGGRVNATGGEYAAGIGTGIAKHIGKNTCGTITINGGMVYATGGERAAGIGTGNAYSGNNECGAITITGGTVNATAGTNGAGIGTGRVNGGGVNTCGAITITGGTVIATGDNGGAGIGTGNATSAIGTTGSNTCGDISIAADVTSVTATKGSGSPNSIGKGIISFIGGTVSQNCGTITFGTAQVFDGTAATGTWTPNPMVADTYGGLKLVISTKTTTDDTWTLTPVAP